MSDIGDGMELAFSDKIAVPLSEHRKALDEIVRLRAEVARKDAALKWYAREGNWINPERARAALTAQEKTDGK